MLPREIEFIFVCVRVFVCQSFLFFVFLFTSRECWNEVVRKEGKRRVMNQLPNTHAELRLGVAKEILLCVGRHVFSRPYLFSRSTNVSSQCSNINIFDVFSGVQYEETEM